MHGKQVLMVNCTGEMSAAARERVRRFVTAGGFLYTTDHAVHHLIEATFPGFLRYTGKTSPEAIFPMEVGDGDRGLLKKISAAGHPRWQLAGGGFLFDVVDHKGVEVLMSSKAVAARYHNAGVLGVRFRVGDGGNRKSQRDKSGVNAQDARAPTAEHARSERPSPMCVAVAWLARPTACSAA